MYIEGERLTRLRTLERCLAASTSVPCKSCECLNNYIQILTKVIPRVAALFRRPYTFPHTYYLTTACALVEGAQEYESDEFLVAQIRLQLLTAKGCIAFPSADSDVSAQPDFGAALYMTMISIRNEVESFKKGLHPELQSHCEAPLYLGVNIVI